MSIERPSDLAPYYDFKIGMVLKKGVTAIPKHCFNLELGMEILLDEKVCWSSSLNVHKIHKSGKISNPISRKIWKNTIKDGDIVGCGLSGSEIIFIFIYKNHE